MSNRYLNQLPYVALAVAALCAQQAHAATQSITIPSAVLNTTTGQNSNSYFEITPLQASAVATNTPIDVYFKGELDASAHCRNVDGCGPVTLAVSAMFNFYVPGAGGGQFFTGYSWPLTFTSYGKTDFGDYLDLKPVKVASDPITVSYDYAQMTGLIADPAHPVYLPGMLGINGAGIQPDGYSYQTFYQDFDHISFAVVNPTFNIHYFAAAVPEPSSYAMLAVGLAALSVVRRRVKQAR